jgi:hypothetical protein
MFRIQLTQKVSTVRPHEFLDEPPLITEPENIDEVHCDTGTVGR